MPVAGGKARKRPENITPRQTLLDRGILSHVSLVVEVYEIELERLQIGQNRQQEQPWVNPPGLPVAQMMCSRGAAGHRYGVTGHFTSCHEKARYSKKVIMRLKQLRLAERRAAFLLGNTQNSLSYFVLRVKSKGLLRIGHRLVVLTLRQERQAEVQPR